MSIIILKLTFPLTFSVHTYFCSSWLCLSLLFFLSTVFLPYLVLSRHVAPNNVSGNYCRDSIFSNLSVIVLFLLFELCCLNFQVVLHMNLLRVSHACHTMGNCFANCLLIFICHLVKRVITKIQLYVPSLTYLCM